LTAAGRAAPVIAALAVAACGSAVTAGPPGGVVAGRDTGPARRQAGEPAAGSRAQASALAASLLSRLAAPPSARPAAPRPVPGPLRQPAESSAAGYSVDRHKFFAWPASAASVAFLMSHLPAGLIWAGNGQSSGPPGTGLTFVDETMHRPPAGIYQAGLVLSFTAVPGARSLLRADAQVTWYPPRTAAEYVDPARFRAVTVSATLLNPKQHTVRRTFTTGTVIARLARSLNSLHADPGLSLHCPALTGSYRIAFAAAAGAGPVVVAAPTECLVVQISAGGRVQPDLLGSRRPIALITRLLGLAVPPPTSRSKSAIAFMP
jgi:hypothetical protein